MKQFSVLLFLLGFLQIQAQSTLDSADVESFLDGVITAEMKEHHIAGTTLALVKGGRVMIAKGYGFADVANQKQVDPETTLFRIGSISKMFVWTSVMQLVAQGKLDLNADINTYLKDFKIPEKFGQPITLKHLMTHTPGFEDRVIGLFAGDSTHLLQLGTILKNELPDRVRPPYTQASYSNHGAGIAAYIVEQVTKMSFHDYAEKNILVPLNMKYTTLRQPLPDSLEPLMSKGYSFSNSQVEKDFEYIPLYPVGAASASALDITHFMMALLNNGTYSNHSMLDSATLALMKSPAHRHHPDVNPMRYGFMDVSQNNVTVIGHGGDTFWFHSLMALLPDHNVGLFISFNTDEGGGAYLDVLEAFMDRYYPDTLALQMPMKANSEWLEQFAGEYRYNRFVHSDITRIGSLFARATVSVKDSTRLALTTPEETRFYVPLDSATFREEFKNDRIVFSRNKEEKVSHIFIGLLPIFALEKVSAGDKSSNHSLIFFLVAATTLITLFYWPMVAMVRSHFEAGPFAKLTLPLISKSVAWTNYLFYFIFLLGLLVSLGDPLEVVYGLPPSVKALFVLPFLMIASTVLMVIMAIGLVLSDRYRLRSRLFYITLCIISALALWQLNYWNFIGFKF